MPDFENHPRGKSWPAGLMTAEERDKLAVRGKGKVSLRIEPQQPRAGEISVIPPASWKDQLPGPALSWARLAHRHDRRVVVYRYEVRPVTARGLLSSTTWATVWVHVRVDGRQVVRSWRACLDREDSKWSADSTALWRVWRNNWIPVRKLSVIEAKTILVTGVV